jgi:hypothetical protein
MEVLQFQATKKGLRLELEMENDLEIDSFETDPNRL